MSQIAQHLALPQAPGALPSATVTNPKDNQKINAVTTRRGKPLEVVEKDSESEDQLLEVELDIRENEEVEKEVLELNISLLEALEQMPTYAKFMKDIIAKKQTIADHPIILTETCSAILQGLKIPVKKKDRGAVTIPCTIGDRSFKRALIDLGASISLMPLSIYKKLGIGAIQDTRMTLQFADHSVKRPYGVVQDVLVKVDKFVFPVDFVILEMPEDEEMPIILGRPFLETGRVMIDMDGGTLTLKVYDEELKINVHNTMKHKEDIGTSSNIQVLQQVVESDHVKSVSQLPLERVLSMSIFGENEEANDNDLEVVSMLESQPISKGSRTHGWEDLRQPIALGCNEEKPKSSELKQLPENLKYDSKPRLLRWILLLQEFDVEIRDKKGCENTVADHLSRMSPIEETEERRPIKDEFADEHILAVIGVPWFYLWDDPYLYKRGVDGLIRRCVPEEEQKDVLRACHDSEYGGHFSGDRTASKVLQSGLYWPSLFKDSQEMVKECDKCQRTWNI
ncbi:uncharacterized protein LOC131605188 [Vicia villosa]|uniref:uncharacterized protein LOC131605188 n=1 Tax=Vicia villosa TaxID=3911 RepID=UPI00273BEBD3|nr:uncharacterized protein LOC131605188 [Vicia villosa]